MSDHRIIAAVTATLRSKLSLVAEGALGAEVTVGPPIAPQPRPEVRSLLYRVTENPTSRNVDLPVPTEDGTVSGVQRISLDLHYLLSFYGDERKLQPELLMGACLGHLHAHPVSSRDEIEAALADADPGGRELPEQTEPLRWTLLPLSHADMAHIWSTYSPSPYVLSVACECSNVVMAANPMGPDAQPRRSTVRPPTP